MKIVPKSQPSFNLSLLQCEVMIATKESDGEEIAANVVNDSPSDVTGETEEDTMRGLLTTVLSELNRVQSLEETIQYLQSEWLSTENDLKVAMQDEATWNALKLPTRLKLSLKAEISRKGNAAAAAALKRKKKEDKLSSGIPTPIDLESFTPAAIRQRQDQTSEGAYLNMAMQSFDEEADVKAVDSTLKNEDEGRVDEFRSTSTRQSSLRLDIEHKAYEGEDVVKERVEEEGDYEDKGLLATIGDDDDDGFRDQVNQMWVKSYSPEHESVYYFNEVTEEAAWSLPEGVEASREDEWAAYRWEASGEGDNPNTKEEPGPNLGKTLANETETGTTDNMTLGTLPPPAGPAPTAYTRPIAPPSAPALPAELVEAFQVEPLSVEATPINSPDQRGTAYPVLVDEAESVSSSSDVESEGEGLDGVYSGRADADDEDEDEDEHESDGDEDEVYSSEGDEDVAVDPRNLQMLMDMGFAEEIAARALQKAHNDMQMATIACLRQEQATNQPPSITGNDSGSDRGQRNSAPAQPAVFADTGTEGMHHLSLDDASPPPPRRPSSGGQRRSIISRIGSSINRTISGGKKARARREDMGISFDD